MPNGNSGLQGLPMPDGEWAYSLHDASEDVRPHLAAADASVLLVAGADKLHNARSLLIDLRRIGDKVWSRFNAGREESLWFYRSVVAARRGNPANNAALVDELERTVAEIDAANRG
jgi:hypothetical protein